MGKQSSCDVRNILHFNDGRVVTEGLETVMGFGETCNTYLEHLVLRMRLERAGLNQGFQGENGRNLYFFFSISTWLSTGTFFSSRYVQPGFGRDSFPVPLAHAGRPQRQTKRNVLLKRLQLYGQLVSRTIYGKQRVSPESYQAPRTGDWVCRDRAGHRALVRVIGPDTARL